MRYRGIAGHPPAWNGFAGVLSGLVVGTALALGSVTAAGAQQATGSWLDGPPRPWNVAGMGVPAAPPAAPAPTGRPECSRDERAPTGAEEPLIARAGWHLETFWPTQRAGNVALVMADSDYDRMCRPWGFNGFVFADGRFAGTISPVPMYSRLDGALTGRPAIAADGSLAATFLRYAATDPLCCPSRPQARVTYRLTGAAGSRVLEPVQSNSASGPAAGLPRTGSANPGHRMPNTALLVGIFGALAALAASALAWAQRASSSPATATANSAS